MRIPQRHIFNSIAYEVMMHSEWAWSKVTKNKGLMHKKYKAHQKNCGDSQADGFFCCCCFVGVVLYLCLINVSVYEQWLHTNVFEVGKIYLKETWHIKDNYKLCSC